MNQILSVETPKKKKSSKKAGVHSIVLVFALILLVFGIGMTSTGAYSYYKNIINSNTQNPSVSNNTKPKITIERQSSSNIKIVVTHDKEIENITYTVNDEEPVKIEGEGKSEIQEKVELQVGITTLNITATDISGVTSSYETSFEVEQKPTIELEKMDTDGKVQITTTSSINIDYVLYYWDEDEENTQKTTVNDTKNVTFVDVIEGTHTLNVEAVDIEGNKTTKTQVIVGVNKPEVKVTTDGKEFIIKAKDAEGITKIEIKLNSGETKTEEVNATEYNTNVTLEEGVNKLTVTVYNKNGLSETSRVKYTKE